VIPVVNERKTTSDRAGRYVRQPGGYQAFIPPDLPPDPPLALGPAVARLVNDAGVELGRLDGASSVLPNPDLFVAMYVRQEAVLSSQIEGTQASLTDVLQFEAAPGEEPRPRDVEEVVNYVRAMNHGLARLAELPLSLRLIKEIHGKLLEGVRGQDRDPGSFRHTQNWIGPAGCTLAEATFVPPPPHELLRLLGNLEKFLHDETYSPLIQAGLAHAQFETIHPFLDGNGRVGRLLITFLLCHRGVLGRPLLYLSHFLKQHRAEYYRRLNEIRVTGGWEEWIAFFLRGVAAVAREATGTARRILALREEHRARLEAAGKAAGNLLRALDVLYAQPVVTAHLLRQRMGVEFATANNVVGRLVGLGLLREMTGRRRNRRFAYQPYLDLFGDPAVRSAASSPTSRTTTGPVARHNLVRRDAEHGRRL
jgi:Fic family protein